jgi:hypothetical protein
MQCLQDGIDKVSLSGTANGKAVQISPASVSVGGSTYSLGIAHSFNLPEDSGDVAQQSDFWEELAQRATKGVSLGESLGAVGANAAQEAKSNMHGSDAACEGTPSSPAASDSRRSTPSATRTAAARRRPARPEWRHDKPTYGPTHPLQPSSSISPPTLATCSRSRPGADPPRWRR